MVSWRIVFTLFLFVALEGGLHCQLKFVVEDFEGFSDGATDLKANGVFTFGDVTASVVQGKTLGQSYSGQRCIELNKSGNMKYGGWGKGIGLNIDLDPDQDYLNFYVFQPISNGWNTVKIEIQEDDNGDNIYEKDQDDSWIYLQNLVGKNSWELISIPLNKFKDNNRGGDGLFNVNYKEGKLFCLIFSFLDSSGTKKVSTWNFDFVCFSKGKLSTGTGLFDAPLAIENNYCTLGAWSRDSFENNFRNETKIKLGVIHFFQPFAVDGGNNQNLYPSVERINNIIRRGCIPMITLENHYVNTKSSVKQPNLYSILEGHFDRFFADWARQIKQVNGTVLLRILHEFNGNWYPWCTVNNDKNPKLVINAYRHICEIFKAEGVTNVRFIWCPNSMSFPQEEWNSIMEAYPGDRYVDFVALDVYNGAGKGFSVWRSFRKEGIENYFVLTQLLPDKPFLICETSSRERKETERKPAQNKSDWIMQMSEALSSDMSQIKLLTWFNEKETFKINSSEDARKGFLKYVIMNHHFKHGSEYLKPLLTKKDPLN